MQNMKKAQVELLERQIIDDKTVSSKIKYGKITVCIKSVFDGKKHIEDVLFNIAKEKINLKKCD
jgi:hypothetical protein